MSMGKSSKFMTQVALKVDLSKVALKLDLSKSFLSIHRKARSVVLTPCYGSFDNSVLARQESTLLKDEKQNKTNKAIPRVVIGL